LEKNQNSDKSGTITDAEFEISLSSEDVNENEGKNKNDDTETQNNLVNDVALVNTCTNCGIEFVPKNSMTFETLCGFCIGGKQSVTEMSV